MDFHIEILQKTNVKHFEKGEWERDKVRRMNEEQGTLAYGNCEKCKNKGFIYRYDETLDTIFQKPCDCVPRRRALKRIESAGLGDQLKTKTFKSFETIEKWQEEIKSHIVSFAKNPDGSWLFVCGQSGAGKSHLCTAALRYLARTKEIAYMEWMGEADRLKAKMYDPDGIERLEYLKNVPVLYIDDLFKKQADAKITNADVNLANTLIFHRYNQSQLITIISTERYLSEIVQIDEALGGRICERSKGHIEKIEKDICKNWRLRED